MKKTLIIIPIITIMSFALISSVPMIPTVFSGTVTYSENPSMNLQGYDINVSINGSSKPEWNVGKVGSGNKFEVDVDPQGETGEILFYIGGVKALETGSYVKGGFVELNLTITSAPTQNLGDGSGGSEEGSGSGDGDSGDSGSGDSGGSSGSGSSSIEIISSSTSGSDSSSTSESESSSNYSRKITPITGGAIRNTGFLDFIGSGYLSIIFAVLIIILGILLLLMPKRE